LGGTLTVLGNDFDPTTVVRLVNLGVLATTYVNTTTLTAQVPTGLVQGVYTVQVRNGAGGEGQLANALMIDPPLALPDPTQTPAPPPPPRYVRPLMTVATYSTTPTTVVQGKTFTLTIRLTNVGDDTAFNIAMTVSAGDFLASGNAGTLIYPKLKPGETVQFDQALIAKTGIGGGLKALDLKIAYNDRNGAGFSDPAPIAVQVAGGSGVAATPTPTPIPPAPQLVVSGYRTDPLVLSPGTVFTLSLDIDNVGAANATRLSAVLGGAAATTGATGDTTGGSGTTSGGVSGAGGDFATFGPIGSSNIKFIPVASITETVTIEQALIVNSTAKAGAYTVKVSLVYDDPKGQRRVDDQVISLIVIVPPALEIGYYRPVDPAFAGQPWPAPIQVVNVGRNLTQLGKMEVTASNADVQNGSIFVGSLEAGGQFPLDAVVMPREPGLLTLMVNIYYRDDFNLPKVISATLDVDVLAQPESPPIEPGQEGAPGASPPQAEETFVDMVWRAFLGLIGLDSGRPTQELVPGGSIPTEPAPGGPSIIPIPGPKG
jgi:hypothetical protein